MTQSRKRGRVHAFHAPDAPMARTQPAPALKRHKRSGNAYARFNGRQLWFGPFDGPDSHARFAAFKARW